MTPAPDSATAVGEPRLALAAQFCVASLTHYYRCPDQLVRVEVADGLSLDEGFFSWRDGVCYGRLAAAQPSRSLHGALPVAEREVLNGNRVRLAFDLGEIVTNLRQENYPHEESSKWLSSGVAKGLYYSMRPLLPVPIRKHLQKARLAGWEGKAFPRWPVDVTVDKLMADVMTEVVRSSADRRLPFIWFWPDGASACAMMTHDVEGQEGIDFVGDLIDVDEEFSLRSSFQLVPEGRGNALVRLHDSVKSRGFEVNIHDLNHDGGLFENQPQFLARVERINRYGRDFHCHGFRSGAMYRNQSWFGALDFSYDMSVPNVAHLEPQGGGCCTVMPYFIGDLLELPLTTTQDYSLFHIIGDYSTDIWKDQIDLILSRNGLVSFIGHPDYLRERRALDVYRSLLAHLTRLREQRRLWIALPGEIDRWWRNRRAMTLRHDGSSWRISGPDSARARLAWASLDGDCLVYTVDDHVTANTSAVYRVCV